MRERLSKRKHMAATSSKSKSLWDAKIVRQALIDSLRKLNPKKMMRNPVMFVVEVGSVITTVLLFKDIARHNPGFGFDLQITLWLWFTVLFANLAEAMAEGRGKAQAETLRRAKSETQANRLLSDGRIEIVSGAKLRLGDVVIVSAGETIPGDGDIIEGVASVDESAITGESAPVIRESGGDRSAVTGGTQVLSDWLIVEVTANPGEAFLDRMIALDILLAAMTIIFLLATATLLPFSLYAVESAGKGTPVTVTVLVALLVCLIPTTIGALLSAIGIAGMDRMIQKNVIAMSGRAVEA